MEYKELLQDIKWITKAKFIRQRDNHTCQSCGVKNVELHVHHKRYYKGHKPWEVENKYLITLCEKCHEKEHQGKDINEFIYIKHKRKSKTKKVKRQPRTYNIGSSCPIKLDKKLLRKEEFKIKLNKHKNYLDTLDSPEIEKDKFALELFIKLINIPEKQLTRKLKKKINPKLARLKRMKIIQEYIKNQ